MSVWWMALALAGLGCTAAPNSSSPCVPNKRICVGINVMYCAAQGQLTVVELCSPDGPCVDGECRLGGFGDASLAKDGSAPQDIAAAKDGADAGAAHDAVDGTDASEVVAKPDITAKPDAASDIIADVLTDSDADASPDALADVPETTDLPTELDSADDVDVAAQVDAGTDAQADVAAGPDADATADSSAIAPDAVPDTTAPDSTPPDPFNPGILLYERLGNLAALDDLRRVAWHPTGQFALILATKGQVLRYNAGAKSVQLLTTLGKDAVDLAADPAGQFFLVLGKDAGNATRLWRGKVAADGSVAFAADVSLPQGDPVAVAAEPGGPRFVIATRSTQPVIAYLTLWQDGKGLGTLKAFNTSGGIVDAMWAGTGLPGLAGSQAIVTSQGLNGAGSNTWVLESNAVLGNGWSPGFGNGGGAAWRPAGIYGVITGTSSNVVYVFDGTWTSTYLPGVNNGAAPQTIGWKGDGTRALVVGRATGSPMAATVIEHRPGLAQDYASSDWVNQSIAGFDKPPWSANFNTFLHDVAWRPKGACDEGLIVGSDTGSSQSPNYGLVIRFYDSDDPSCQATP